VFGRYIFFSSGGFFGRNPPPTTLLFTKKRGPYGTTVFAKYWQQAKQTVLGCGQATPSHHQGLLPELTIQPI
jgi:hypothetical protein